jgi:hypothetical protein
LNKNLNAQKEFFSRHVVLPHKCDNSGTYAPGTERSLRSSGLIPGTVSGGFFCIEDASIVEICQDGPPLKNPFKEVARTVRVVYLKKTGSALVKG